MTHYPDYLFDGTIIHVTEIWSEDDILNLYYPYWKEQIVKKYGPNSDLICKEKCIQDWKIVNFAFEYK